MTDFLSDIYLWTKTLHIISVFSWMAGLFYLPRLFVHHVEQAEKVDGIEPVFDMMEVKLLRLIMNPAMIATWVFGLMLVFTPGIVDWSMIWPCDWLTQNRRCNGVVHYHRYTLCVSKIGNAL